MPPAAPLVKSSVFGGAVVVVVVPGIDVVVVAIVVEVVGSVVVVVVSSVVLVVVVTTTSVSRNWPGSDTAPGPGRLAEVSIRKLPVAAMQKVEASVTFVGTSAITGPAGTPFSVILRQSFVPKQPT